MDGSGPGDRHRALSAIVFAGRIVAEFVLLGSQFALSHPQTSMMDRELRASGQLRWTRQEDSDSDES
ncbi:hypothetical protein DJ010_01080 [Nocardioides silvaticus]|uniref:Uncharacterized protein n=1 Tax=Nocardioides silvaticus TaxID=2201891 RepID=A0A316TX99_9ACTN|nr:hypothetical protein DJ010_01080 [Nocardioides silvaticus]